MNYIACSTIVTLLLTMNATSQTFAKEDDTKTLIVAHRGASADAPENTLPAFNLAWEHGADAVEGDFYLTKDGEIVCIHDANTERTTGIRMEVSKTTLKELRKLDYGSWKGEQWKGTKIPTIAEVFSTIPPGKKIYIEIKIGPEIIPPLLKEIRKSGLQDEQIVIISFDPSVIHAAKVHAPQFTANWLAGLEKDENGKTKPSAKKVLTILEQTGADGFSSVLRVIDQPYIQQIMDAGYQYHVWTVNDLKTAQRFKRWGAKSITTDVPKNLGAVNN